jgi:hypothetical protein
VLIPFDILAPFLFQYPLIPFSALNFLDFPLQQCIFPLILSHLSDYVVVVLCVETVYNLRYPVGIFTGILDCEQRWALKLSLLSRVSALVLSFTLPSQIVLEHLQI